MASSTVDANTFLRLITVHKIFFFIQFGFYCEKTVYYLLDLLLDAIQTCGTNTGTSGFFLFFGTSGFFLFFCYDKPVEPILVEQKGR